MKRSTERILTTHTGSLARPDDLLQVMREKENHRPYDRDTFDARAQTAVVDIVHKQCEIGIDIPSDGEQSKSGFWSYQAERFSGFEVTTAQPVAPRFPLAELDEFKDYYDDYFGRAMFAAMLAPNPTMVCTGPVTYTGQAAVQGDIESFKAGLEGQRYVEAFIPSANPLELTGRENRYYPTQEEFEEACIDATRAEYQAIIDAGFILQVDDPALGTSLWGFRDLPPEERQKKVDHRIEQINHALRGLPEDRIRYHSCYSINQGPLVSTMPLREWIGIALRVNAQAVCFEAMNPRHMHDYHAFETIRIPEGKIIIPGMLSHGHNWVEHPELIAELTVNYARLVDRENVQIGNDCGFASQAGSREVNPKVALAKLAALVEGARIASQVLF
jgi:5-methyltetrahydropteroyltriglutamate--homocysteine methyltransferase